MVIKVSSVCVFVYKKVMLFRLFLSCHRFGLCPHSSFVLLSVLTVWKGKGWKTIRLIVKEMTKSKWKQKKWRQTRRLCTPRPEPDLECWVRWATLGCRARSVWSWWPDANLSPRPTRTNTPYQTGKRSDGIVAVRTCTWAEWTDNLPWRAYAICTVRLPTGSGQAEGKVTLKSINWKVDLKFKSTASVDLLLSCPEWRTPSWANSWCCFLWKDEQWNPGRQANGQRRTYSENKTEGY